MEQAYLLTVGTDYPSLHHLPSQYIHIATFARHRLNPFSILPRPENYCRGATKHASRASQGDNGGHESARMGCNCKAECEGRCGGDQECVTLIPSSAAFRQSDEALTSTFHILSA
jgi:hypothetical protein